MKNIVLFTVGLVTAAALGTVYSKLFSLSVSIVFSLCTGSFIGFILGDLVKLEDND